MNRVSREKGWRSLGILTWNTRIGLGFTEQTWSWVWEHIAPLHVLFLQEVTDPTKVARILGDEWYSWPLRKPGSTNCCVVAIKARRFRVIDRVMRGNRHGSKHERHIMALEVFDKRSERPMLLGSIHVDPLGNGFIKANALARRRHINQVDAWCRYIASWLGSDMGDKAVFVGGDVNEHMREERQVAEAKPRLAGSTTIALFRGIRMIPAHLEPQGREGLVKFDDIFSGGRGVKVEERRSFTIPEHIHGAQFLDHSLVHVVYSVRRGEDL